MKCARCEVREAPEGANLCDECLVEAVDENFGEAAAGFVGDALDDRE